MGIYIQAETKKGTYVSRSLFVYKQAISALLTAFREYTQTFFVSLFTFASLLLVHAVLLFGWYYMFAQTE